MTSSSGLGSTSITLQFDLNRTSMLPRATSKPPSTPPAASFLPIFPAARLPKGQSC